MDAREPAPDRSWVKTCSMRDFGKRYIGRHRKGQPIKVRSSGAFALAASGGLNTRDDVRRVSDGILSLAGLPKPITVNITPQLVDQIICEIDKRNQRTPGRNLLA